MNCVYHLVKLSITFQDRGLLLFVSLQQGKVWTIYGANLGEKLHRGVETVWTVE